MREDGVREVYTDTLQRLTLRLVHRHRKRHTNRKLASSQLEGKVAGLGREDNIYKAFEQALFYFLSCVRTHDTRVV